MIHVNRWVCVVCGGQVYADLRAKDFLEVLKKRIMYQEPLNDAELQAWEGNLCSRKCYDEYIRPSYVEVMVAPDATWHKRDGRDMDTIVVNAPSDDLWPIWFPDTMSDEDLDTAVHELMGMS